jgi:hypothetical protein
MCLTLTVFFEDPFYVGVLERNSAGRLEAARVVFGAEPSDGEVLAWFLSHYRTLPFSPSLEVCPPAAAPCSPKRMQREASRLLRRAAPSTAAQLALQAQHETSKADRRSESAARRRQRQQQLFQLKQERRKQKRRGR